MKSGDMFKMIMKPIQERKKKQLNISLTFSHFLFVDGRQILMLKVAGAWPITDHFQYHSRSFQFLLIFCSTSLSLPYFSQFHSNSFSDPTKFHVKISLPGSISASFQYHPVIPRSLQRLSRLLS